MSITFHPEGNWRTDYTLNVSEGNAPIAARMMGLELEKGRCGSKYIPLAIIALTNVNSDKYIREDVIDGNFYDMGCYADQIERYQKQLSRILKFCRQNKVALEWS